ncbi:uncharacterized protein LOC121868068 [Homarus americanus]|uniref:Neoverrucotoxin subunit beta-like n=1 Tax=Homarus americanus TaxID=6706 RepID=A0A8J5K1P0_HOMAM|nr:uncharacterized protein LOC121868068 [Homarus americanus]XP_042224273.1 uncharacterized protein LOC121868068 [Homarus americanus]KAG7167686.1 Neoverrucotoxin subunit beta-like [Homarus americanus]
MSVSSEILTIAALGRPFRLGMLYDCRSEKLIPGITLWDKVTLEEKTVQQLETSDFHLIASDSLENKTSALDVNASLKLSFLGGLLEVSGSAKYLDNRKSSNLQERVTLQYKCTTRSEEMTMEQLGHGRVQHPEVFDHGTATHVVTGVEYGGQAFFVFDRQHSSSSHCKEVHGELHAMVKAIPTIQIDGEGQVDISEDEKKRTENFSCRFYGDFLLRENPCCYEDAVRTYKNIPNLLGKEGQNAVPVKVRLYPLTLLDSKASKLVREISTNLISETERVLENLYELNVKCNDLYNSNAAKKFLLIREEISKFKSLIAVYKSGLQRELSVLLPRIRGGGAEESCLTDILRKKESSPFSCHDLHVWIQDKEKQVKILNEYVKTLSEVKFMSEYGDLESTIMSPVNDYTVCFTLLMPRSNFHRQRMEKYTRDEYDTKKEGDIVGKEFESDQRAEIGDERDHGVSRHHLGAALRDTSDEEKRLWDDGQNPEALGVDSKSGVISIMEKAMLFKNFFECNKLKEKTAFIVAEDISSSHEFGACIRCYKNGRLVQKDYKLPSAPSMPQVANEENSHDSITIYWTAPECGASNIQEYEIICQDCDKENQPPKLRTSAETCKYRIPNLYPNCKYEVKVQSWCEVGVGPSSDANPAVSTRATSPPGKPLVFQTSLTSVELQWSKPEFIGVGCKILYYIIKQQDGETTRWSKIAQTKSDELSYVAEVSPNTTPRFRVSACCGNAQYSVDSDPSGNIIKKVDRKSVQAKNLKITKEKLCGASKLIDVSVPCIYLLDSKETVCRDHDMIRKYQHGVRKYSVPEKVIMLVGSTGSGKTTFINGLINYIFGVNWEDEFRFKLITEASESNQARSQTKYITSYTLHHEEGYKLPSTLTIIDTPGFGDTSGVMRDREITNQIRNFFMTKGVDSIDHIDAVGFVAQSSLPRLTPTQTYIFDQVLSLFGKDIADNIFLLLTFADGQKPQVLSGIKESGMPYRKHFKFNNSALYANNTSSDENMAPDTDSDDEEGSNNFDKMFWQMGAKSFNAFLQQLNTVQSKSLTLTQGVLNERNHLEVYVMGIQKEIKLGLNTLEVFKKELEIVKQHEADIDKNKNFTYTVDEEVYETFPIPHDQYITNCLKCYRTCHEVCGIKDDNMKSHCWAITNDNCRICPNKCHWSMHRNFPYKYVLQVKTVEKTAKELKERYENAMKNKLTAEELVLKIQDDFKAVQLKVLGMTESVRKSLERLQEIALKPNPLSTVGYIDILIDSEQSQAQPGWQARVQQLRMVRKEAEYMQQIADRGFDPFQEYKKKIEIEKKTNKNGIWSRAGEYLSNIFKH